MLLNINDMKNVNNQDDCLVKKQGRRIQISFGAKTNLTEIREFISANSFQIKNLQNTILSKQKIKNEKRKRYTYNTYRDKRIHQLSKMKRDELYGLIIDKETYKLTRYKDQLIAEIINQDIKPDFFLEKDISPKKISSDNVRKIVSRQNKLFLQGKR